MSSEECNVGCPTLRFLKGGATGEKRDKGGPPSRVKIEGKGGPAPRSLPRIRLARGQCLVWTFDFLFGLEEFFTPRFACALGALVNRVPNSETVIAGSLRAGAGELLAFLARLKELAFERPVLIPQFVFTYDAHALLLSAHLLPEASGPNPARSGGHRSGLQDSHAVRWNTG